MVALIQNKDTFLNYEENVSFSPVFEIRDVEEVNIPYKLFANGASKQNISGHEGEIISNGEVTGNGIIYIMPSWVGIEYLSGGVGFSIKHFGTCEVIKPEEILPLEHFSNSISRQSGIKPLSYLSFGDRAVYSFPDIHLSKVQASYIAKKGSRTVAAFDVKAARVFTLLWPSTSDLNDYEAVGRTASEGLSSCVSVLPEFEGLNFDSASTVAARSVLSQMRSLDPLTYSAASFREFHKPVSSAYDVDSEIVTVIDRLTFSSFNKQAEEDNSSKLEMSSVVLTYSSMKQIFDIEINDISSLLQLDGKVMIDSDFSEILSKYKEIYQLKKDEAIVAAHGAIISLISGLYTRIEAESRAYAGTYLRDLIQYYMVSTVAPGKIGEIDTSDMVIDVDIDQFPDIGPASEANIRTAMQLYSQDYFPDDEFNIDESIVYGPAWQGAMKDAIEAAYAPVENVLSDFSSKLNAGLGELSHYNSLRNKWSYLLFFKADVNRYKDVDDQRVKVTGCDWVSHPSGGGKLVLHGNAKPLGQVHSRTTWEEAVGEIKQIIRNQFPNAAMDGWIGSEGGTIAISDIPVLGFLLGGVDKNRYWGPSSYGFHVEIEIPPVNCSVGLSATAQSRMNEVEMMQQIEEQAVSAALAAIKPMLDGVVINVAQMAYGRANGTIASLVDVTHVAVLSTEYVEGIIEIINLLKQTDENLAVKLNSFALQLANLSLNTNEPIYYLTDAAVGTATSISNEDTLPAYVFYGGQ